VALKREGDGLALVYLKRTVVMCGNWNVRQATSQKVFIVTCTFCTDTRFQSFSPLTMQLHCPPCFAEIQPMSQQDASTTRPYCGFVLDAHALAACPRRGNLPGLGHDWSHVRTDELRCLTAQKLDCVTSTMCWHIVLLEDKHISSNAADRWLQLLHQQHVSVILPVDVCSLNEDELGRPTAEFGACVSSTNPRYGRVAEASRFDMG